MKWNEDFLSIEFGNRLIFKLWEDILLKVFDYFVAVRGRPIRRMFREPLTGDYLEAIGGAVGMRGFHHLAVYARINAIRKKINGMVAPSQNGN